MIQEAQLQVQVLVETLLHGAKREVNKRQYYRECRSKEEITIATTECKPPIAVATSNNFCRTRGSQQPQPIMYGSFRNGPTVTDETHPQHQQEINEEKAEKDFGEFDSSGPPRPVADDPLLNDDEEQPEALKKGTIWSGIVNLSNTIVGAGMLGLPGALGGTGFVGGSLLMVLGAAFSAHGLVLLSKSAQRAGLPSSFYSVARAAVPQYTMLIDLAVTLKCFGVATGYLITVADCMLDALTHLLLTGDSNHDNHFLFKIILSRRFWVVGATLGVLPVSFYKTLDELKKASALALVFVFMLAFGIVAYANGFADPCAGQEDDNCRGDVVAFTDGPTTLSKLPIFIFAFTCHQNIFPIVNEIQKRSQERLNVVIVGAIGFAFVVFYVVAMEGYTTFGSNVRGDVLLNYPANANVTLLRICIALMLSLHYPLQLDPSRRCITSLIKVVQRWKNKRILLHRHSSVIDSYRSSNMDDSYASFRDEPSRLLTPAELRQRQEEQLFYGITIGFVVLSFVIAMIVDDLGVVLAMVGATGSTLVSYILPGLIYWKLQPEFDRTKVMALVQLVVGCLVIPVALYYILQGKASH